MEPHFGAAAVLGECDGNESLRSRRSLLVDPAMREHQTLRRDDLAVHPAQAVLGALGRAHTRGERTADAQLAAVLTEAITARARPLRQQLRLGPGPEHQLTGCVEGAPDVELALGRGTISRSCVHVASPVVAIARGSGRGGGSCLPSSGGSARPTAPLRAAAPPAGGKGATARAGRGSRVPRARAPSGAWRSPAG